MLSVTSLAIIIPARRAARRFPGKVLYPILGRPLVLWVVEGAKQSRHAQRVIVATDDREILETVREAGFEAELTRHDHPSGTDRVWEVAGRLEADWIINLQGDEPLITGDVLDQLAEEAVRGGADLEMATLVRVMSRKDAEDPNRVKVVVGGNGDALYFSRSLVPYPRNVRRLPDEDGLTPEYLLHVGVYLYRRDILKRFVELSPSALERIEGLEQLRALENGIRVRCVRTEHEFLGVDAPEDVGRVEEALRARMR